MELQGEKLKKIRLEKGLSLEEAQKKTKININVLKAIEGDSITNLQPIYLKGFLKIYCNFLGVDPKEFLAERKEAQAPPEEKPKPKPKPKLKTQTLKLPQVDFQKIKTALILFIIIGLSGLLLFNLGKFISAKQKQMLAKKQKEQSRPLPVQQAALKNLASGIRLGIRARENCWIQVKTDGRVVFQKVLERGRFESWQAKDRIELSLGNAGAVELEVNGQVFSNLGRRGEVRKNILINKQGLNIEK